MSTEIKFREWDGLRFFNVNIDSDEKVFQLFTGLKDKNGKEIFEGDICKIIDGIWHSHIMTGTVHYDIPNAAYSICDTKTGQLMGIGAPAIFIEVIGNIFENPELLNEK